jgi:hypothetical protein
MTFHTIGKLAGALALTFTLAGCIDMTMEIEVQSETTAKATVTSTMGADIYPMVKASAASESNSSEGFCKEEGSVLTENPDGGATCVQVSEGSFADLKLGDTDSDGIKFETVSPGIVRMSFSTADMKGEMAGTTGDAGGEEMDEETKAMMTAFFEGHSITIRAKGREIVAASGMTISGDKTQAEVVIPFLDLINGTTTLPDVVTADIKVN